ncbi:hypothetical protein Tco_0037173, partial [Tanacetum coccineum]
IKTLLPFSSENEDTVFNPGILPSNLLSRQGKITSDFSKSSMMISGGDIPFLAVLFLYFYPPLPAQVWGIEIASDYEDFRARGFIHRPLDLQSFTCLFMGIRYPISY